MNRKAEFLRNITIKISNEAKYNAQIMVHDSILIHFRELKKIITAKNLLALIFGNVPE